MPNAVPALAGDRARPESRVAVAAGRLNSQKGFDLLIAAWRPVAAAHPDWQLRIYGRGPQRAALAAADRRRRPGRRRPPDGCHPRSRRGALAGSLFVLSSRFEGFGIVLVEAMSKGLAVVSFDCPRGPGEIIDDGRDGCSSRPATSARCRARCSRVVEDEERRRTLGSTALESARRYDPEAVGADWAALVDESRRGYPDAP